MGLSDIFHIPENGKDNKIKPGGAIDPTNQARVIIDSIDDGVILIDANQTVKLINPGAATICGWKPEEATGISSDLVIQLCNDKGELIAEANNPLHKIFQTGQSFSSNDFNLLSRSNKTIPISLHVSPILDKNKQVYNAVAVFADIAEEKSNEKQRADFISTASHEMRTPVAAIEGYLALALNDKVSTVDNRARGYLEKAHSSTEHLGKLFQDLLTSAKAEDGRLTSNPQVIDMTDYLKSLTNDLKVVSEKKGLAMDFVVGNNTMEINATSQRSEKVISPLYYVYVDPDRLREVITNLFDNAIKYTMEGTVTIGLTGNNQVVQAYVKDTGPGIPADDLPHLFQKFYRVDNSATRTVGGTGLGLFICRKIIEMYNGRIWAESTLGQGSTFYINLPRLSAKDAKEMTAVGHETNIIRPINTLASA
ncbi:MAG TPA: ATP-binding protein [Candidatus Sulfotelmatobacter sp.]|nr:ATP-binding protein [Candidatus Sulfotelmatobacter sp.]